MPDKKRVEFIESYIKIGNGDYKWNDNHGELIRCKECERHGLSSCPMCSNGIFKTADNWYCADGERS